MSTIVRILIMGLVVTACAYLWHLPAPVTFSLGMIGGGLSGWARR